MTRFTLHVSPPFAFFAWQTREYFVTNSPLSFAVPPAPQVFLISSSYWSYSDWLVLWIRNLKLIFWISIEGITEYKNPLLMIDNCYHLPWCLGALLPRRGLPCAWPVWHLMSLPHLRFKKHWSLKYIFLQMCVWYSTSFPSSISRTTAHGWKGEGPCVYRREQNRISSTWCPTSYWITGAPLGRKETCAETRFQGFAYNYSYLYYELHWCMFAGGLVILLS